MPKLALALTLSLIAAAVPLRADEVRPPLRVVANILSLSDAQVASWLQLLQARNAAVQPLQQQLEANRQAIATLLQSGAPDPAVVGQLFLDAHGIELQIQGIVAQANAQFEQLLTDDQRGRLQHIREAAQVCPIVPALQATGLL